MALSIQSLAVCCGRPALGSRWNARRDATSGEGVSECITIIALVGNKRLGVWQHWIDQSRALMVTHLSFCEKKDNWPASAIANRVQLGVQLASPAANDFRQEERRDDHHHYRF